MNGKTMFLLVSLVLAAFVFQGCNGPSDDGREAPYVGSLEGADSGDGPTGLDHRIVFQPKQLGEEGKRSEEG